ncbi:unnamed protein product, partial [Urochloa humidicola]
HPVFWVFWIGTHPRSSSPSTGPPLRPPLPRRWPLLPHAPEARRGASSPTLAPVKTADASSSPAAAPPSRRRPLLPHAPEASRDPSSPTPAVVLHFSNKLCTMDLPCPSKQLHQIVEDEDCTLLRYLIAEDKPNYEFLDDDEEIHTLVSARVELSCNVSKT